MHLLVRFALPPEVRPSGSIRVQPVPRQREPAELVCVGLTLDAASINLKVRVVARPAPIFRASASHEVRGV